MQERRAAAPLAPDKNSSRAGDDRWRAAARVRRSAEWRYTSTVLDTIHAFRKELDEIRRDFHAHPELGLEQHRTAAIVADKLETWGIEVHRGVGRTGVVGVLRRGDGGASIGLRADMDGLPIVEQTNLPYCSRSEGRMHACGYDGHTTMLLGAARYLATSGSFNGTVNFIFQPGEEGVGGALAMLAVLSGTAPAFDTATMGLIEKRMTAVATGAAQAFGAEAEVDVRLIFAPLINAEAETDQIADAVASIVGEANVDRSHPATMGSEDFSFMIEKVSGAYIQLGNGDSAMLHNPAYNFNDEATPFGAALAATLVERRLGGNR